MTTYYVRTIIDFFPFNVNLNGFSEMQNFEAYDFGYVKNDENKIFTTSYFPQSIFYYAHNTDKSRPPTYSTMTVSQIFFENLSGSAIGWFDGSGTGWNANRWQSLYGWSNPDTNNATWINELCTKFDTLNKNSVVSNNSGINLLIFKYRFANYTENLFGYFPVFYVGNDPNCDTTVVI